MGMSVAKAAESIKPETPSDLLNGHINAANWKLITRKKGVVTAADFNLSRSKHEAFT